MISTSREPVDKACSESASERIAHAPNPFADSGVARRYEAWYAGEGRRADVFEKALLRKLLASFPSARSILDVGCGTGHFTRWMAQAGFDTVGLDLSEAMLNEARRRSGGQYVSGDAHALPFADRSYDVTALITALEFVADPAHALSEAIRVARKGVLLGVLNRWSVLALRYRLSGKPLWRCARFFGARELAGIVQAAAGQRAGRIRWRTTLWPVLGVHDLSLPWGGFIGMAVQLHSDMNT
jgi:SAM-dependent methyltransferase